MAALRILDSLAAELGHDRVLQMAREYIERYETARNDSLDGLGLGLGLGLPLSPTYPPLERPPPLQIPHIPRLFELDEDIMLQTPRPSNPVPLSPNLTPIRRLTYDEKDYLTGGTGEAPDTENEQGQGQLSPPPRIERIGALMNIALNDINGAEIHPNADTLRRATTSIREYREQYVHTPYSLRMYYPEPFVLTRRLENLIQTLRA
jgi:hypothetical protein